MSQSNTLWSQSLDHDSKQDISKFIKADDKDRNESLRAIADFAKGGGGGGAQNYPLTVGEGSKFTVKFIDQSGNEITEAPAGTIVMIDCESMGGNSGILICTDQGDNYTVFEKNGELGNYDIYTAVPIGGLTATVYVN